MYIRGFDGLRALAVLLVFLTHRTEWGAHSLIGFAGVWIFFLLSGFLITGQLRTARMFVERGSSTIGRELVAFWLKRAFRIFPAYYVLILLATPFYLSTGREVAGLPWYLSYLSNIYFQLQPSEFLTTWAHFWTLAVEEQFYLLFAPLMLLVPFRRATAVCLLLVAVSLVQRFGLAALHWPAYAIYIDSLVNFGLLATGALMFMHRERLAALADRLHLRRRGSATGMTALICVVGLVPLAQVVAGPNLIALQAIYVIAALAAAALVASVYTDQSSMLVQVLEWRPLALLGRISYGLYLYNDYIKVDLPERLLRAVVRFLSDDGQSSPWIETLLAGHQPAARLLELGGLLTGFAVLLVTAWLSWMLVEQPALRARGRVLAALDRWRDNKQAGAGRGDGGGAALAAAPSGAPR